MAKRGSEYRVIFAIFSSTFFVSIMGCNPQYAFTPTATVQNQVSYGIPGDQVSQVFKSVRPALAVRGASCLSCHANVQSSVITDFGNGDAYFLDMAGSSNANGSYYFNHALASWQTAQIQGSLIVPAVNLSRPANAAVMDTVDSSGRVTTMTLAQLLQTGQAGGSAMAAGVTPVGGAAAVIEKKEIYIGAPKDDDLLGMASDLRGVDSGFRVLKKADAGAKMAGLKAMGSGSSAYLQNDPSAKLECVGDVVVKGTLFLNAPTVVTGKNGCRLYVIGSVFLQGQITYEGDADANLQITSSRAIMIGFNLDSLKERLAVSGSRTWVMPFSYTRGSGTNAEKAQAIVDDAMKVSGLMDAGSTTLPFSHLLLNAPQVHSRYIGEFRGAVIGEIVLFRLGNFSFSFDSLFERVLVLPLLPVDILRIVD